MTLVVRSRERYLLNERGSARTDVTSVPDWVGEVIAGADARRWIDSMPAAPAITTIAQKDAADF
jgi:hypothetical protein